MYRFVLIGAAGYIAPRHLKAIQESKGELVAAIDPSDSVGILDSFFPEAEFFTDFERFDGYINMLSREKKAIDYVVVCSPNYLHDAHIRYGLRIGAHVICEKPIVLNPEDIVELEKLEVESAGSVSSILQLRLHPSLIELKRRLGGNPNNIHQVDLTYITSRGGWYMASWKGEEQRSGGIASNIGVHFFDMLLDIFGGLQESELYLSNDKTQSGFLKLERAQVRWFLSIDSQWLPEDVQQRGQRTFRNVSVDGDELEFSGGFTDLHTESYKHILSDGGFGLRENYQAIELVASLRSAMLSEISLDKAHPFLGQA